MERFARYRNILGLSQDDAELLSRSSDLAAFFESALLESGSTKLIANWVVNDVARVLKDRSVEDLPFSGSDIGALVSLIENETISNRTAKDVFAEMVAGKGRPADLVTRLGLQQISDRGSIAQTVSKVLSEHPNEVNALKSGKEALRGFFIGQVMKATRGKANPKTVQDALDAKLEEVMQSET